MESTTISVDREGLSQLKVLANHIYELEKGVRKMALYTTPIRYAEQSYHKIVRHDMAYFVQPVDGQRVNIYLGRQECIDTVRKMIRCPLHHLTPEEDFILGMLLGYDVCAQCERYCKMKERGGGCVCCSGRGKA